MLRVPFKDPFLPGAAVQKIPIPILGLPVLDLVLFLNLFIFIVFNPLISQSSYNLSVYVFIFYMHSIMINKVNYKLSAQFICIFFMCKSILVHLLFLLKTSFPHLYLISYFLVVHN